MKDDDYEQFKLLREKVGQDKKHVKDMDQNSETSEIQGKPKP